MCGQDCLIDLTGPSTPGKWKRKTRSTTVADTIDLSGSPNTVAHVVDLGRRQQADGAGPSTTERPAKMVGMVEAESPNAAADSETEESKSSGKRKRCWATDRAKQAEAKKQQLKAQRAEASALKAEAKAAKKAAEQKRVDPFGKIVRYASKPSEKTKERMARAMPNSGHRLFLLDRHMVSPVTGENGPAEKFSVLGATANVYEVTVGRHPDCSCPDFQKGNICKHYLFVMLRVLRLDHADPLVWQRALMKKEAQQVLGGTRSTRADADVLADQSVISHYRRLTGKDTASTSSSAAGPAGLASKQRPIEGECAICYDSLKADAPGLEDKITFCQECGNNVHVECFKRWTASKKSTGQSVTCVYCRCPWVAETGAKAAGDGNEEYVNLRGVSQQHQQADTSLESLYGDTAVWIQANNGRMGRRQAASLWRLSQAS
ncbi:hypothetical protein ABBQ38_004215 [Trebouxia sp. C0009 RCD-2024]